MMRCSGHSEMYLKAFGWGLVPQSLSGGPLRFFTAAVFLAEVAFLVAKAFTFLLASALTFLAAVAALISLLNRQF